MNRAKGGWKCDAWRRGISVFVLAGIGMLGWMQAAPGPRLRPELPEPRHGLRFTNVVMRWDEAIPIGNAILGGLVWGDGQPLKISLDRTDLWDLRPVPEFYSAEYRFETMERWHREGRHEDLVRLYEAPYNRPAPTKIPAGRLEITMPTGCRVTGSALELREAMSQVDLSDGGRVQCFLDARSPVGMVRWLPSRSAEPSEGASGSSEWRPRLVAPPFAGKVREAAAGGIGAGDLAQLGYAAPEESSGADWQAFRQVGVEGLEFVVHVAWRQRGRDRELAWSVASSWEGRHPAARARALVERALRRGFDAVRRDHASWWRQYWEKSTLRVPNEAIERQWFLEQYKFGSASRRGYPPITLQGPWTADDGQLPPWKGDYHHDLNTQLSYWPCYSGNRLEEGLAYLDWLWDTRGNCENWTKRFFGMPGMNVPMTSDLRNNQIGGWRQYTHSATTAAWLAQHFYWHWKYSADAAFLRSRAYPYARESSVFIEAITQVRDVAGRRRLPLSSSPEIHDNRPEAWFDSLTNYDLALIRWLLSAAAEMAEALGEARDAARWRLVLAEFPDWSVDESGALLVAAGHPLKESHRHFSHLMAIHPLGLLDVEGGEDSRRIVEASLRDLDRLGTDWWCGYSYAWLGNMAARAIDGEKAARALEIFSSAFTLPNSFHCNGDQSGRGYSKMTYRPFTLEGNFAMAAGVQEMLLQSHRGRIEVFPAIPSSWKDVFFSTLRAEGAFLVSARQKAGRVEVLEILSERGGECRVRSPWTGSELRREMRAGDRWVIEP